MNKEMTKSNFKAQSFSMEAQRDNFLYTDTLPNPAATKEALLGIKSMLNNNGTVDTLKLMAAMYENEAKVNVNPHDTNAQKEIALINRRLGVQTDSIIAAADPYMPLRVKAARSAAEGLYNTLPDAQTTAKKLHEILADDRKNRKDITPVRVRGGSITAFVAKYPKA